MLLETALKFSERCSSLFYAQAVWSLKTFDRDAVRGPVGPLKHLAREALEAAENPTDITEYADCLLLLIDASGRAGFTAIQIVDAAHAKLAANKLRTWPAPDEATADEPVEHVR